MADSEAEEVELVEVIQTPQMGKKWPRLRTFFPSLARKGQYDPGDFQTTSQDDGAPKDHYHLVYIAMVMAGMGFLVPWTSYIGAIDYFFYYYQEEFPAVSVIIPIVYLVTTFLSCTLNLFLVRVVAIHSRIMFGYFMFITSLLMIPLLDIGIANCTIPTGVSFYITLFSIFLVGLASGVQQSSYYGLSSQLPKRYTQAVMAGESVAGVVESLFRILTKASVKSNRIGALIFFSLSICFIIVCMFCHQYIKRSKIVKFYTRKCRNDGNSEGSEDGGSGVDGESMSDLDNQLLLGNSNRSKMEMEENVGIGNSSVSRETMAIDQTRTGAHQARQRILSRGHLKVFWSVVIQIWPLICAIFIDYFVTLLLFPGLLSLVQNCTVGSWTPVLLIAIFNAFDFCFKWFTLLPIRWSPKQLLVASISRIVFVPLIVMCVSPSPSDPVFGASVVIWASFFSLALGSTNGYFGSLPLIVLSGHVKEKRDRELAGTIMTWVLLMGLLLGAICAYALTPLTTLQDNQLCSGNSTNTEFFDQCGHGNMNDTVSM